MHMDAKTIAAGLACLLACAAVSATETLTSPDGRITVSLTTENGLVWSVARDGQTLVQPSPLGLRLSDNGRARTPTGLRIAAKRTRSADETWTTRLSRRERIRDHFNELAVDLEEGAEPHAKLGLVFRAYDEGVAFRYVIPELPGNPGGCEVMRELTEWRFAGDPDVWATTYRAHFNSNEQAFLRRRLGSVSDKELVGMPLLVDVGGQTVAITEAALSNWAGFYGRVRAGKGATTLAAELSPLPPTNASTKDAAVVCTTPARSPWRVLICGADPLDLIRRSDILLNLNPPPEKGLDFSWVKPGATSWDWWVESNNSLSTELTLKLVDFASEMGWPYHTIDGGWYGFARRPNHGPNVKIEPRATFDLHRIIAHAKAKNVGIWVWLHWQALEDNGVEATFEKLHKWGVKGVKIDFHDRQDQWMVCWFERVLRAAAKNQVMVNFHGAHKPTGIERTWPNNLTREGIRGNEMTKFTAQITPEHCATLPFTRFLLGSGDFTPGSFGNVHLKDFSPQCKRGHRYGDETDRRPIWAEEIGTRGHALALCVAYDSALTTLCDWPERYRGAPGIEALRALPTTWRDTIPLAGAVGEHYSVLRETFDGRFYFAAFTVKGRTVDLPLGLLPAGEWTATLYADGPNAATDAKELAVSTRTFTKDAKASVTLADEGGAVVIFTRKEN